MTCTCRCCGRGYDTDDYTSEEEASDTICPDCLYTGNIFDREDRDFDDEDDLFDDPDDESLRDYEELLDGVDVPDDEFDDLDDDEF